MFESEAQGNVIMISSVEEISLSSDEEPYRVEGRVSAFSLGDLFLSCSLLGLLSSFLGDSEAEEFLFGVRTGISDFECLFSSLWLLIACRFLS